MTSAYALSDASRFSTSESQAQSLFTSIDMNEYPARNDSLPKSFPDSNQLVFVCGTIEDTLGVPKPKEKSLPDEYKPEFNEPVIEESALTDGEKKELLDSVNSLISQYEQYRAGMVTGKEAAKQINDVLNKLPINADLNVRSDPDSRCATILRVHYPGADNFNNIQMSQQRGFRIMGRDASGNPQWMDMYAVQAHLQRLNAQNGA